MSENIKLEGVISVERDHAFDDPVYYRSGGIRLLYQTRANHIDGIKSGILLEAGFDTVAPNRKLTISSWAYDRAKDTQSLNIIDNRAIDITCYHPGYTFVEKLQTVATKFRQEQNGENDRPNFMRQYYDIYCLLENEEVQKFIGTQDYETHKQKRFPAADLIIPISENEAFLLTDPKLRAEYKKRYLDTAALYYKGQPEFKDLLNRIKDHINKL